VTAVVAISCVLGGCLTYYVAKDDPQTRTAVILFSSEVAVGSVLGTVLYLVSNENERLPLAGSIAVAIGAVLVLDVAAAGIVAIVTCDPDEQDSPCKK